MSIDTPNTFIMLASNPDIQWVLRHPKEPFQPLPEVERSPAYYWLAIGGSIIAEISSVLAPQNRTALLFEDRTDGYTTVQRLLTSPGTDLFKPAPGGILRIDDTPKPNIIKANNPLPLCFVMRGQAAQAMAELFPF